MIDQQGKQYDYFKNMHALSEKLKAGENVSENILTVLLLFKKADFLIFWSSWKL